MSDEQNGADRPDDDVTRDEGLDPERNERSFEDEAVLDDDIAAPLIHNTGRDDDPSAPSG